jgi:DNA polymerase V
MTKARTQAMMQNGCSALEPYALRVLGDSMAPEFPEGCVIIVDPGHAPKDGSYVIVEYAGDIYFRRLVIDGERRFLEPLNPKYGGFELVPPYTIRGGVVQRAGRRRAERKHYT